MQIIYNSQHLSIEAPIRFYLPPNHNLTTAEPDPYMTNVLPDISCRQKKPSLAVEGINGFQPEAREVI